MTAELHQGNTAGSPWQRSLLGLVGMLLVAAGVLGYIALGNEADYRTIMRDPVRIEADMIDGGPSGRFGYVVKYRFRVDNLINTGRIHVSEDDWQWISASKKVPVVYARDNPHLFDTNPEAYRDSARKYAWVAIALTTLVIFIWLAGPHLEAVKLSEPREEMVAAAAAFLVFSLIGTIQAASAVMNYRSHRDLHINMQAMDVEIERTWSISRGRSGSQLMLRYRSNALVGEFAAPNSTWHRLKPGDRVTAYYAAENTSLNTLEPNSFRRSAFFESLIALVAFALVIPIGLMLRLKWRRGRRLTSTPVSP